MGTAFWIKRFLIALVAIFVVILSAHLLRGRELTESVIQTAIWAPITAAIYVAVSIHKYRKGVQCAVCAVPPQKNREGDA